LLKPPDKSRINATKKSLIEIGALEEDESSESKDGTTKNLEDCAVLLTPLGKHLAKLPIDVRLAKMLVYAVVFRCLDPILTIAAAMSFKSIFIRSYDTFNTGPVGNFGSHGMCIFTNVI
jgi:ATP-dependent RNA helicase DHX57